MNTAKELRIGNLVNFEGDMISVTAGDIHYFDENLDSFQPIPLTPEILEKAGFEYYAWPSFLDFTHYIKNDFILRETGSGYSFFNTSSCDNSERQFLVQLSYLHQLQNIYFALTGEELPIEL